jgi:hypothetical protein
VAKFVEDAGNVTFNAGDIFMLHLSQRCRTCEKFGWKKSLRFVGGIIGMT